MASQFVLHEDGTVAIGWGEFACTLREPVIGEILSFARESEEADKWARGESAEGEEAEPKGTIECLDGGPYLALYQRIIAELAGVAVDASQLPVWLATGDSFRRLHTWWLSSPLSRADQVAVTRTLSR